MSWFNKAHTYFSNNFVMSQSTKGWWMFSCPFCNELSDRKKCAVKFTWNLTKCWVCEWRGSIIDFVMEYENVDYTEAKSLVNNCKPSGIDLEVLEQFNRGNVVDVELPKGYTSILEGTGILGIRARNYLKSRGFDLELLDRLGVGYCNEHGEVDKELGIDEDYFGYIIIPFKRRGLLSYFIARDFIGNFLRCKNPPMEKFSYTKFLMYYLMRMR